MRVQKKIIKASELSEKLAELKSGGKVVFTNGCFDLLHPGHIDYLTATRALGDFLIVGVNDDASVSRLKGPQRPINKLADRMVMLAALESVDVVIAFSEDTPLELIKKVKPDLLVKGGDYDKEEIVGASEVEQQGGTVVIIPFKEGYSSTALIEKIKGS